LGLSWLVFYLLTLLLKYATNHTQTRYPQAKKTTLKIRLKNAHAQTAHLFFTDAKKKPTP